MSKEIAGYLVTRRQYFAGSEDGTIFSGRLPLIGLKIHWTIGYMKGSWRTAIEYGEGVGSLEYWCCLMLSL